MNAPATFRRRFATGVVLVAALLAAALAGCSQRDRANPLDPANPQTGGRPTGFDALAGFATVRLSWDARPLAGLEGFLLERRDSPDSAFRALADVFPNNASQYLDSSVRNGTRYEYRLSYVRDGGVSGSPATDTATPGRMRPWVVDAGFTGAGFVARLSPDGRDVVERFTGWSAPTNIAVDGQSGLVWVSEPDLGQVHILSPAIHTSTILRDLQQPLTIALDPATGDGWICDLGGVIRHYDANGGPLSPNTIPLLDRPSGVAVWARDRSLWACERGGERVRRWDADGVPQFSVPMGSPSRVAVDSASGRAYVTSLANGRVLSFTPNGTRLDSTSAALGPIGVAVDPYRGRVWVADAVGNQLLGLRAADLSVAVRVTGMSGVRDVAVDLGSGEVWAVVNGTSEIWRLSAEGSLLDRRGGFDNPQEVRLDQGWRSSP